MTLHHPSTHPHTNRLLNTINLGSNLSIAGYCCMAIIDLCTVFFVSTITSKHKDKVCTRATCTCSIANNILTLYKHWQFVRLWTCFLQNIGTSHLHISTYMYMHMHTHAHAHQRVSCYYLEMWKFTYNFKSIIYTCTYVHTHIRTCTYVSLSMCIYMYIYGHKSSY